MEYKNIDKIIDFTQKYVILEDDIIEYNNRIFYRIQAIKDFVTINGDKVKKGDKGGYIENELNLSHYKNSWISDGSIVGGETRIVNGTVVNNSKIFGYITIRNSIIENSNILTDFCFINSSHIGNVNIENNFKIRNSKIFNTTLEKSICGILKNIEIKNKNDYFYIDFENIFLEKKRIFISLGYDLDKNGEEKKLVIVNDNDITMNYKDYLNHLYNVYSNTEIEKINSILNSKSNREKLDMLFSKI